MIHHKHQLRPSDSQAYSSFNTITLALITNFPDLDLRFSMAQSSAIFRYYIADNRHLISEVDLNSATPETLIQQAVLEIKSLTKRFDA